MVVNLLGAYAGQPDINPSFDCFNETMQGTIPQLQAGLAALGLKLGIASRPSDITYQSSWDGYGTIRIDPGEPTQVAMILQRFANVQAYGIVGSYMDSTPLNSEDSPLLPILGDAVGSSFPMYPEYMCSTGASLAGSWYYIPPGGEGQQSLALIEVIRLVNPNFYLMTDDTANLGFAYYGQQHYSPVIGDQNLQGTNPPLVAELQNFAATYLDGQHWKTPL
jgi:hypothetical protein